MQDDSGKLLDTYRRLSAEGRNKALDYIKRLLDLEKIRKGTARGTQSSARAPGAGRGRGGASNTTRQRAVRIVEAHDTVNENVGNLSRPFDSSLPPALDGILKDALSVEPAPIAQASTNESNSKEANRQQQPQFSPRQPAPQPHQQMLLQQDGDVIHATLTTTLVPGNEEERDQPPFMTSLAKMHGGPSASERLRAEQRKQDWLRGLEEQVREQRARKQAETRQWREDHAVDLPPVVQRPASPTAATPHKAGYQQRESRDEQHQQQASPRRRGAGPPVVIEPFPMQPLSATDD
mmetsp:Transcript_3001/g.8781  ORF Transcript_3001/g.8781 Transcript_3001/m.8781 type:complete len:293 (-) Transcript_3001:1720-2598(-)